jgi:hypothetical protein
MGIMPGNNEGIFGLLNSIIEEGPVLLARGIAGAGEALSSGFKSVVAGVSALKEGIGNIAGNMDFGRAAESTIEAPKLGLNASPERVVAREAMQNDPQYAFNNHIQAPTVGVKVQPEPGLQV